ncbi:hypothetical protein [Micromonospora chersina]|uniref:hypothetical protein n=1 Tax=Micromonospora chersina TaxID=47854 RepID=UPI00371ED300
MDIPTWLEYAGFVFNVLATAAGLVGLFLAIKAYKVGVQAYEVSAESYKVAKEEGRKNFELEILRELRSHLDAAVDSEHWAAENPGLPRTKTGVFSALLALPPGDLPLWRMASGPRKPNDGLTDIRAMAGVRRYFDKNGEDLEDFRLSVVNAMYDEINEAMRKRIE